MLVNCAAKPNRVKNAGNRTARSLVLPFKLFTVTCLLSLKLQRTNCLSKISFLNPHSPDRFNIDGCGRHAPGGDEGEADECRCDRIDKNDHAVATGRGSQQHQETGETDA